MSLINGVPFIKTLIESLTSQQLNTLKTLIDGGGNQTVLKRTTNTVFSNGPRTRITTSDKGICRCSLEIADSPNVWNGYLIYTDSYCVLIYYTNSSLQALRWLTIDVASQKIEYINEELSVLELRNELVDIGQSAGTVVVANPTLAGTEDPLTGLEINGTKYAISGGTKLYEHVVLLTISAILNEERKEYQLFYTLISLSGSAFTLNNMYDLSKILNGSIVFGNVNEKPTALVGGNGIIPSQLIVTLIRDHSFESSYKYTFYNVHYPGATPNITIYDGHDEIDLTTGRMKTRTQSSTYTSPQFVSISDTVTEL